MSWAILGKNRRNWGAVGGVEGSWDLGIGRASPRTPASVKRRWLNIVDVVGGGGTSD